MSIWIAARKKEEARKRLEPEEYVQQQPEKKRKVFQDEREQSDADTCKADKKCCVCLDSAVQCAFDANKLNGTVRANKGFRTVMRRACGKQEGTIT